MILFFLLFAKYINFNKIVKANMPKFNIWYLIVKIQIFETFITNSKNKSHKISAQKIIFMKKKIY